MGKPICELPAERCGWGGYSHHFPKENGAERRAEIDCLELDVYDDRLQPFFSEVSV